MQAGRSSLTFAVAGRVAERLCFTGTFVSVFVDRATGKSRAVPDFLATAIAREAAIGSAEQP